MRLEHPTHLGLFSSRILPLSTEKSCTASTSGREIAPESTPCPVRNMNVKRAGKQISVTTQLDLLYISILYKKHTCRYNLDDDDGRFGGSNV